MIKKLLIASLFAGVFSANAQQVQNPGFETWANAFPTGWGSLGQLVVSLGQPNPNLEVQTTVKHSGTYAVLMTSQVVAAAGGSVVRGLVNTGPITLVNTSPSLGRAAYASTPTSYDFWYQYAPTGADTAYTQLVLSKWNTTTSMRDTLAIGAAKLTAIGAYTHVTVPIYWLIPSTTPDSIQLQFGSSLLQTSPQGSQLYLDDVNFTTPVGIESYTNADHYAVFPNPSSEVVNIVAKDENAVSIAIYDITGKKIAEQQLENKQAKVYLDGYENGFYLFTMLDKNKAVLHTGKFAVSK